MFPGVPTLYDQVLDHPRLRPSDLRAVRVFISGASDLSERTAGRLGALGGYRLSRCRGLTEASPAVTANPLGPGSRNSGTVGVPLPGTEVRVVDQERPDRVLGPGQPGELVVRGPQVFAGYWNAPWPPPGCCRTDGCAPATSG